MNKKLILIFILSISLIINGIFVYKFMKNLENPNNISQYKVNKEVLDFRNMFTDKVLLSDGEVDFNTRLSLETAVRNLNDTEIFNLWQLFVNTKDQADSTIQAKKLLKLLIEKTSI